MVYLEDDGRPVGRTVEAWPEELYGVGWHHGGIKRLIERLPLQGAPLNPAPESEVGPGSGHHALNVGVRLRWQAAIRPSRRRAADRPGSP